MSPRKAAVFRKKRLLDILDVLKLMSDGRPVTLDTIRERVRPGTTKRQALRIYNDMVAAAKSLGFEIKRTEGERETGGRPAQWAIEVDDAVGLWDATQRDLEGIERSLPPRRRHLFRVTKGERQVSTSDTAEHFGTFPHTLLRWAGLGAPHTVRRVGAASQPHFFWSIDELEDWIFWAAEHGVIQQDPRAGRAPVERARKRLLEIREKLNLSVTEFAKLLGISASTLSSWLYESTGTHTTVPAAYLAKAERLLETREPLLSRLVKVTRGQVDRALKRSEGSKEGAARILGIDSGALRRLMLKHEIPGAETIPIVARIMPKDIREAMREAGNSLKKASKSLGISLHSLRRAIQAYGIEGEFQIYEKRPRLECDPLRAALEQADGSVVDAARILGVNRNTVRAAMERCGLIRF